MSGGIRNVWDAAANEVLLNEKENGNTSEKCVLYMGGKSSGKTTAMLKFLSRDDQAKPTTALEYTFARRAANLQQKQTGHIWELGGGTHLSKLLDIPLNYDTLQNTTILLFLDLSDPNKLWSTAESLLKAGRDRLDVVMKQGNKHDSNFHQFMLNAAWERIGGKERNDAHLIKPFPIPLVIIGSKFDLFQTMEADKKKNPVLETIDNVRFSSGSSLKSEDPVIITKCIRFLAHSNGATAIYVSSKIDATLRGFKHIMNVCVFDGQLNKTPIIDSSRPLYIPAGMDSMDAIGLPSLASNDVSRTMSKNPFDLWKVAFCGHFPQDGSVKRATIPDPAKDQQFREPKIDELRAQKDKELEAFKKQESQKWTNRLS